jgi:hypothetical protein
MERHYEARKRKTRGVMVLVFMLILIIALLMAFLGTLDDKPIDPQYDNGGDQTESVYQNDHVMD